MTRLQARARLFACLLAALAGYVDAAGFLRSGGFFVSFMSGNSTRLGIGIAASLHEAMIAGGIIAAFLGGVIAGSLVGEKSGKRRPATVLAIVALVIASSAALHAHVAACVALLAVAMGAENAVFERGGEVRLGVTYMTGSLVRVGGGIAGILLGRSANGWLGYLVLWFAFVAGVVLGVLIEVSAADVTLWAASGTAALLALASARLFPSE